MPRWKDSRAPAVPRAKAAPIARPSRDYAQKIAERDYNLDDKAKREEDWRRAAEARLQALEEGRQVDLGRAGEYWEKVANSTTAVRAPRPAPRWTNRGGGPPSSWNGAEDSSWGDKGGWSGNTWNTWESSYADGWGSGVGAGDRWNETAADTQEGGSSSSWAGAGGDREEGRESSWSYGNGDQLSAKEKPPQASGRHELDEGSHEGSNYDQPTSDPLAAADPWAASAFADPWAASAFADPWAASAFGKRQMASASRTAGPPNIRKEEEKPPPPLPPTKAPPVRPPGHLVPGDLLSRPPGSHIVGDDAHQLRPSGSLVAGVTSSVPEAPPAPPPPPLPLPSSPPPGCAVHQPFPPSPLDAAPPRVAPRQVQPAPPPAAHTSTVAVAEGPPRRRVDYEAVRQQLEVSGVDECAESEFNEYSDTLAVHMAKGIVTLRRGISQFMSEEFWKFQSNCHHNFSKSEFPPFDLRSSTHVHAYLFIDIAILKKLDIFEVSYRSHMIHSAPEEAPPLKMSMGNSQVDDLTLCSHCENFKVQLQQGLVGPRVEGKVDLSGNWITDCGVKELVNFIRDYHVVVENLDLGGNKLLHEPQALVELLLHPYCGLHGENFRQLRMSEASMTAECCWRILEACHSAKPRPPLGFTIVVAGNVPELGRGQAACGGNLAKVFKKAEEMGLRVARDNAEADCDVALHVQTQSGVRAIADNRQVEVVAQGVVATVPQGRERQSKPTEQQLQPQQSLPAQAQLVPQASMQPFLPPATPPPMQAPVVPPTRPLHPVPPTTATVAAVPTPVRTPACAMAVPASTAPIIGGSVPDPRLPQRPSPVSTLVDGIPPAHEFEPLPVKSAVSPPSAVQDQAVSGEVPAFFFC